MSIIRALTEVQDPASKFTESLKRNIENTYTYSYVKNALGLEEPPTKFKPLEFFMELTEKDPFGAFMALDMYGFKRAKQALDKYEIPYSEEQERVARVFYEVTEEMNRQRSDYITMYIEDDLTNTGVERIGEHTLTTADTIRVHNFITRLDNSKAYNLIFDKYLPDTITQEQREAIELCLTNKVSCLIGGAGTGKSFVTSLVVKQLKANHKNVAILAPTHKAREALQSKIKEGGQVRTIHSFCFSNHNKRYDAIVIDESGMLSTELVDKLRRTYRGEQLIFVGDKNQLPPVGYGRPFERIQKEFPMYELTENHRSEARDIIALGREILGFPTNANMARENITLAKTPQEAFEQGAEVLLTFTNKAVAKINEQQRIKGGTPSLYYGFCVGEKIIAKTNEPGKFYNGQVFEVTGRNVIRNTMTGDVIIINKPEELYSNFDYAYGLTIHKSQGSEWNAVAYMPSENDTQNLAYVAVTRAKRKLIIVGDGMQSEYRKDWEWKQLN